MVHTPSLLLKCVNLPVVPTLRVSCRVQREGTKYASGRGKDAFNGSECTYKSCRIPVCICRDLAIAALLRRICAESGVLTTSSFECQPKLVMTASALGTLGRA